jgi:Flp pilus assembly protein TadB
MLLTALTLLAAVAAAATVGLLVQGAPAQAPPRAGPPKRAADLSPRVPGLRILTAVAAALGPAVLVGGVVGVLGGVLAGAGSWWFTGRSESRSVRRRRQRLAASVPHVVDLMAACLAAGLSPTVAVERIGAAVEPPVRDELTDLAARLRLGSDPTSTWRDLAGHPELGGLGRSMARACDSGASVAEAMQRLAEDSRRRTRARMETRARGVGVRAAVPLGLCLLPAFVLVGVVPLVAGSVGVLLRG